MAATGSRALTAGSETQRPALTRCRSVRIQAYPEVEYQGYFLKRKLTSNVCNRHMNIHDLWGGFHNDFILLRLI